MLDKELGKDIKSIEERKAFLRDNCDKVEEITYSKSFSTAELAKEREALEQVSIKISDIETERDEAKKHFKEQLEPLLKERATAVENLRKKAKTVTEQCCKFYDEDTNMIGYYNDEGNLVSSRPAFPEEMQRSIFSIGRKNGTEDY